MSYAEIVSDEIRARCRKAFGLEIIDCYSAREAGYIALQCPDHMSYHLQSETIKTEILDIQSQPCNFGETGRVVVTPLYNYAMPLIRYEIRDHATIGVPCSCGRGLPVLTRIAGRTRNLFRLPNGALIAPDFKTTTFLTHLAPRQWQIAQTGPLQIEVRLVPGVAVDEMDFDGMTAYIRKLLHPDFAVSYRLLDSIPIRPGGKHEDYLCELPDDS
jgi:phenylacetate-CoA ligase